MYALGALDFGRVSYVGSSEYLLTSVVIGLARRGKVQLTRPHLEEFLIEIAASSEDPVDVIRVAVDLASTITAVKDALKVRAGVSLFLADVRILYICRYTFRRTFLFIFICMFNSREAIWRKCRHTQTAFVFRIVCLLS